MPIPNAANKIMRIMAALELFCHLAGIDPVRLLKEETILLEAELVLCICEELKELFRQEYKNYFHLMRLTIEKENIMLDHKLIRLMIMDILSTNEYNVNGIAKYMDMPEDVIHDVIDGYNTNPSSQLLLRSIDMHRTVRRDLYNAIRKKVAEIYFTKD